MAFVETVTRVLTADLEKVGPKGYIHGWIHVGTPAVGADVFHPRHGSGKVTRHDEHGHVHVRFDSGKKRSFGTATGTGGGGLIRRSEHGNDEFTRHLTAGAAASRRKDYVTSTSHYERAAGSTNHPVIRADMLARAKRDRARIVSTTPQNETTHAHPVGIPRASTTRELAVTDQSGSAHNLGNIIRRDDTAAADALHQLRDDLRSGKIRPEQSANEFDRIAAAHPGDSHAHWQLSTAGPETRRSPHYGHIMEPPPPTATPPAQPISTFDEHMKAADDARAAGDHAKAINHLLVAERHAPDKTTRRTAADRRAALAAGEMGKPAPQRSAISPTAPTVQPASKYDEHVRAADAALAAGDRAKAINHLMAAAPHAPDNSTRRVLADRQTVLAAEEMGVPVPKDVARRLAGGGPTHSARRATGTAARRR